MKFLIIGEEFMWTGGAWKLQQQGESVRVFCETKEGKDHLKGMVTQVDSLEAGLSWVGKDGYIIREDEKDVSSLRQRGFRVYGGNKFTQQIENDRVFQSNMCAKVGINTPNYHKLSSAKEAIRFITENPDQYVLKQMGHAPKTWNYVGKLGDGSDVVDQLEWVMEQEEFKKLPSLPFMLQEFVDGIEFAVSGWWMGTDWKRRDDGSVLLELNKEHKKQGDGDTGLSTGEMGTVMKLTDNYKLFEETLDKLTPLLKKECSDVIINIDANCGIVEERGETKAYLYEITPREGYPACALSQHLLTTLVGKFYSDLIDRKQGEVEHVETWGVITVLGSGMFPRESTKQTAGESFKNQPVYIPQWAENKNAEFIIPFYIRWDDNKSFWRIADDYEYVLGVVANSTSIKKANDFCVKQMEQVEVRAPQYRHDIGVKFEKDELPLLKKWGYAP